MNSDWKKLERHPLSAEYPNISGTEWESFKLGVKNNGIVNQRKIILYQGKILDGWQLFRACVELNVQPDFDPLPEGTNPETFVKVVNDHRRHEDQATMRRRAEERRERIAGRRQAGESIRTIAENEGVSSTTVKNDLDNPRCSPCTPEKVTGKDGKEYNASKVTQPVFNSEDEEIPFQNEPPKPANSTANGHHSNGAKPSTTSNGNAKKAPGSTESDDDGEMVDDEDYPVPARLRAVFAERNAMRALKSLADRAHLLLKDMETKPWYKKMRSSFEGDQRLNIKYSTVMVSIAGEMHRSEPHTVHQACSGDGCVDCHNLGYFSQEDMTVGGHANAK